MLDGSGPSWGYRPVLVQDLNDETPEWLVQHPYESLPRDFEEAVQTVIDRVRGLPEPTD